MLNLQFKLSFIRRFSLVAEKVYLVWPTPVKKASGRQARSAASGIREKEERAPSLSLPDPARRPPAFSIVHTDREPGTG